MHRFYLSSLGAEKKTLVITDSRIVFQANKVLRMKKGSHFHLFDGEKEYLVEVEEIGKRKMSVKKMEEIENKTEAKLRVALYQAIPKKPALFELIVQKATELGVSDIYPLVTERTENRRMYKMDRLEAIAMEATEQCGRLKIPTIHHPVNYDSVVSEMSNGFIAYEYEDKKVIADYEKEIQKAEELQLIIGPEGGLSKQEVDMAKEAGIKAFSFGPRILRTETAAIAGLSLLLCSHPE